MAVEILAKVFYISRPVICWYNSRGNAAIAHTPGIQSSLWGFHI